MKTPLGQLLERFRQERGMAQSEMAKRIEISQPHLCMIEKGEFPLGIRVRDSLFQEFKDDLTPEQKTIISREMWKSRTMFEIPDGYDSIKVLVGYIIDHKDELSLEQIWECLDEL